MVDWLSRSACTMMWRAPFGGVSIQKLRKNGNSSPFCSTGVDGQAACRESVDLTARHRPEIAGALEDGDFVEHLGAIDGSVHTQTRKGHDLVLRRRAGKGAELKQRVVRLDRLDATPIDDVDVDRLLEEPASGQKMQLEVSPLSSPDGSFRAKANIPVLVVAEMGPLLRQVCRRRFERFSRHPSGKLVDVRRRERSAARVGASLCPTGIRQAEDQTREKQGYRSSGHGRSVGKRLRTPGGRRSSVTRRCNLM